jgi:hypothetical protein
MRKKDTWPWCHECAQGRWWWGLHVWLPRPLWRLFG